MRALVRLGPYALLAAAGAWAVLRDGSPRELAVPLLVGVLLVSWMAWMRRFVLANSAPAPDPARARRLVRYATVASEWSIAIVFAAATWPRQGPLVVALSGGVACLTLPVALVATYARSPAPEPEVAAPPGGWLVVPRANGTGLRFAPGHPAVRSAVLRFLAWPAAAALLLALLA